MIQCAECELCEAGPDGRRIFRCDPFSNIKEPECITKWQLIRLDMLTSNYQKMFQWQKKFAPLSEKILKYMEREINDMDDSEGWKYNPEDDEDPNLF